MSLHLSLLVEYMLLFLGSPTGKLFPVSLNEEVYIERHLVYCSASNGKEGGVLTTSVELKSPNTM